MQKRIYLFWVIAVVVFIFGGAKFAIAGTSQNTSGFGWSETIGWISFNNSSDGSSIDYGVNLDTTTGEFSGYAWSDNIGWISFNKSDLTGCPQTPCIAKVSSLSDLGKSDVSILGWARALAGEVADDGWDGWIQLDQKAGSATYMDKDGYWHGWAWGDTVVGWISWNSAEGGGADYNVYTDLSSLGTSPTADNLAVSSPDPATYCGTAAHHNFSWVYHGSNNETKFQIQVDNNSNFSSPEFDNTVTGTWSDGDTNTQSVIVSTSPGANQLAYGQTYYWRVMVWDSSNRSSGWVNGSSFSTALHPYPSVSFSWDPDEPKVERNVTFHDESTCDSVTCESRQWVFTDASPASSSDSDPTVQFSSKGNKPVSLTVKDSANYSCTLSRTVTVSRKGWIEIPPWF